MSKKVIIGVIIAILIGTGGCFYFYFQSQSQKSSTATTEASKGLTKTEQTAARSFAEKILKLLQNRDYGKLYDLLTNEDRAAESKTDYVKRATENSGATTITSWQIREVLEEQGGASIQYVFDYTNPVLGSGSETGILNLVQKNGEWFLYIGSIDIARAIIKGLGDEIVFETIKFKINAVREQQTIIPKYGNNIIAKEGAKFIVVDMSITNITKVGFDFPNDAFVLVDNQDRQFNFYSDSTVDNSLNWRQLPPSISERGVIVYEVPADATSYFVRVIKSGTNEVYKIILK